MSGDKGNRPGLEKAGSRIIFRALVFAAVVTAGVTFLTSHVAFADESGTSFWLPGTFGSLAAAPGQPGLQSATTYYHTSVEAGAGQSFQQGGRIETGLGVKADLFLFSPNYVFATPILGGQLAVGATGIVGSANAGISGTLTGPMGNAISASRSDSLTSFGDLYPMTTLKWNQGTNNFMIYASGDIPVGSYDPTRLSNIGLGHAAIDGGAGYTYFNPATGYELSTVAGLTYNFENPSTNYKSGVDFHVDWAASKFLTKQLFAGLVGYGYNQIGCDSGSGDRLGCFRSHVVGIGPQVGYLFPVGGMQGYVNLKGYGEFANKNRPDGFNVWLTFAIGPSGRL